MAHQTDKFYADTPHGGGWVFFDAVDIFPAMLAGTQTANLVLTRNALGDYSLNRTAGGAETYQIVAPIGTKLHRLLESQTMQIPGQSGTPFSGSQYIGPGTGPGPVPLPGFPPFTATALGTIPTAFPAKGIQITDVAVVYLVGVAGLTSAALSLNQTVFVKNVANVINNFPIAATALPLVTQANPYVAVRAVTTPLFNNTDLSDMTLEFSPVMANTGTIRIYGLGIHVNFNYD
jgi:hypothetical protein